MKLSPYCRHFKIVCPAGHVELRCKKGREVLYGENVAKQKVILCLAVHGRPKCNDYGESKMLTIDDVFKRMNVLETPGRPKKYERV